MKYRLLPLAALGLLSLSQCNTPSSETAQTTGQASSPADSAVAATPADTAGFQVVSEQFADLRMLRYEVPGFNALTAKQKEMLYYLYEAALSGRDIVYDQNYRHNLRVRHTLEALWPLNQQRLTGGAATNAEKLNVYTKRVWFSNGIHHHYSTRKFVPECTAAYFEELVRAADPKTLPLEAGQSVDQFVKLITPIIFDPKVDPKQVNQEAGQDLLLTSATNYYGEDVTQAEAEAYYAKKIDKKDPTPISYGLNSKLVKNKNGQLEERVWSASGMYGPAIKRIVYWLNKALPLADTPTQQDALRKLISYYETGSLKTWDAYNIAWVKDIESPIDVVNGFIEVYDDPLGYRATYESVVSFRDEEATKRIKVIGEQAQWFEDHSPILPKHKKKKVVGITAKVITVVVEAGDAAPSTPIGINLPNATWIRATHGSKSVNLGNIVEAYDQANSSSGVLAEFAFSPEEIARARQHGALASKLHTDMHEVIGHASGQINPGVGTTKETLKSYASALEEARADLVALYYLPDAKLQELGVTPSGDVAKAEYDSYLRNGLLTQLTRLQPGETVEESHMRNRQAIAKWVLEKGKKDNVVEMVKRGGNTYVHITDYNKLRTLFGELLREMQRITSEGDYAAGKSFIETYGVQVDPALHKEVLARYAKLKIAPYQGFIQPRLVPKMAGDRITDVSVEYPTDFAQQMLDYGRQYKFLPNVN